MKPESSSPSPGTTKATATSTAEPAAPSTRAADLANVFRILAGQVVVLDEVFRQSHGLAAQEEGATETYERMSRLALRAQAQSARTGAVLGRLAQLPLLAEDTAKQAGPDLPPVAGHADPNVAFYSNRPRLMPEPGTPLHDLFEVATSSQAAAGTLNEMLRGQLAWPSGGFLAWEAFQGVRARAS